MAYAGAPGTRYIVLPSRVALQISFRHSTRRAVPRNLEPATAEHEFQELSARHGIFPDLRL